VPHTALYQPDRSNLIGRWKIVKEAIELQSTNRLFSTESPTRLIQWEVHQKPVGNSKPGSRRTHSLPQGSRDPRWLWGRLHDVPSRAVCGCVEALADSIASMHAHLAAVRGY